MVTCTPHPGWGTVTIEHRVVDLATCRTSTAARKKFVVPTLTVEPDPPRAEDDIMYRGQVVHGSPTRLGSIELFGLTPDRRWVLFALDPQNSASLAADGLTLQAVRVTGGEPHVVAAGLLADDYRTWCGGRLVMTAGGDRMATHHKWLIVTGPPGWRARVLLREPRRAFGALACAGDSVVVQSARATGVDESSVSPRWSLWRVRLADGSHTVLDTPPRGYADDSPRVARDGRVVFIRSRNGNGVLTALHGPALLDVGHDDGYYGHRQWSSVNWSLERP